MPLRSRAYAPVPNQGPIPAATGGVVTATVLQDPQWRGLEATHDERGGGRDYRPGNDAVTLRGVPIGAAGVKHPRRFTRRAVFTVDDEPKPAPIPTTALPVRESLFQPWQRAHLQFHVDAAWGRVTGGRYPRVSLVNGGAFFRAPKRPAPMVPGRPGRARPGGVAIMRPKSRFTKVVRYPRRDPTPGVYGEGSGK